MFIGAVKALKQIPPRLIYRFSSMDKFNMFSTKTGELLGHMQANVVPLTKDFYPITKPTKSLYLNKLEAYKKGQKIGTDFIKFGKYLSKTEGGEGRIHLIAYNAEKISEPPHKFYRKLGFACHKPEDTKIIDEAIKNNQPLPIKMFYGTCMFLEKF